MGACASAVSSDARNIEGPNAGNVTCTGSEPTTVRPPAPFLKAVDQRLQSATLLLGAATERADARRRRSGHGPQRLGERTGIVFDAKRCRAAARPGSAASRCSSTPVRDTGRSSAGSVEARPSLVGPLVDPLEIDELDDEGRRVLAGAALLERQQHRVALRRPRAESAGPPTSALHTVAPAGSVTFRKLRWLLRTA